MGKSVEDASREINIYIYTHVDRKKYVGYIPIQDNIIKYYQWMFFFFFLNQYDIYLWPIYPDARASMSGLGGTSTAVTALILLTAGLGRASKI